VIKQSKTSYLVVTSFLVLSLVVVVYLKIPEMIDSPNKHLAIELSKKETVLSDYKIYLLIWLGANASAGDDESGEINHPKNVILFKAIRNERYKTIPLLKAHYTPEQIEEAYNIAKNDCRMIDALDELFSASNIDISSFSSDECKSQIQSRK